MKYSLQCKYSMINEIFLFVLKSMDENIDYSFQWQIKSIDKPVWILTNNNIIIKAETINDLVEFHVVSSDEPLHEKNIYTSTVPILTFETKQENLEIIYDFIREPSTSDRIVGEIISQVINACGGGFLTEQQEYTQLEQNIKDVLMRHKLLSVQKEQNEILKDAQLQAEKALPQVQINEVKPKQTRKKRTTVKQQDKAQLKNTKRTRAKKTVQKGE